ncbi:potassium channel, putative [Plasmodium gallinaceum]|uniref:Potassium channel, putative n=1 Tax=Plasmodium gallinaceum TaxID=5849 RepID=A0A1J1GMA7_PLAGA|nr:potassium channel, putative [Plasmodium gallinaceum]CRG93576.1 potassium channel, putative [Plasmodium gallinaceum]
MITKNRKNKEIYKNDKIKNDKKEIKNNIEKSKEQKQSVSKENHIKKNIKIINNKINDIMKKQHSVSSNSKYFKENEKIKDIDYSINNSFNKGGKIYLNDDHNNNNFDEENIKIVYDNNFSSNINSYKKKRKEKKIRLFRIQNYIYKIFTSLLCLFIVILILYASIDISINYGPIIILYILVLELGSMLISYILLQFPFFYRYLKNIFMRARNVNKYSHQYRPLYYDNLSNSDKETTNSAEKGNKWNSYSSMNINKCVGRNSLLKRNSFITFLSTYKSKKKDKKKKDDYENFYKDKKRIKENKKLNICSTNKADELDETYKEKKNIHRNDYINNYKRKSIYLDDCNVWIKKNMRKSNKKSFKLTKSLSFSMGLNKNNNMIIKDSASLDNLKLFLDQTSNKFIRNNNKLQTRKSTIYNKYIPLTFASAHKNNLFTEILKAHPKELASFSSDYSSSDEEFDNISYKNIYFNEKPEKEKYEQEMINNEKKSRNNYMGHNPYATKNAILFHKKKKKKKKKKNSLNNIKCFNKIKNLLHFFIYYNMKSPKSSNNIFLFFRGLYIYTKHRFIHYVSYQPIWIVAILIRIVLWCIIWIWAASYMERKPKNFKITEWDMKNVPSIYGYIECTFQWCGVFDYFVGLYFSNNKLKYIFSFFSLIDFITTPVSSLVMNFFFPSYFNKNYWFLILGPLRFLRLVRAESTISSCFFWLNDVKIIIIGIIILALAILFTFSGIMYILEAPDIERDFVKPLDFVYFGVITMSTVGYGDYTPVTKAGKFLTMFIIITCISFVAAQFKRLKEAMFSPKTVMGIIPKQDDDYILILGPVSPIQLLYICKGIYNSFPNSVESIFLFTPLPVIIYRYVYGSIVKNTNIKLCISGGNECFICPSVIYDAVINARALYILNNVDCEKYTLLYQQIFLSSSNLNFSMREQSQIISSNNILHNRIINKFKKENASKWNFNDIYSEYKSEINRNNMLNLEMNININNSHFITEKDDQQCLLRFIGTYNICNSLIPITLQLSNNTYKDLIKSMNVYNYLSIEELKYALIAKSVNCKGLFFLIINFFYKPKAVNSLKKYIIDLKLLMYSGILKKINKEKLSSNNIKTQKMSKLSSSENKFSNFFSIFKRNKNKQKKMSNSKNKNNKITNNSNNNDNKDNNHNNRKKQNINKKYSYNDDKNNNSDNSDVYCNERNNYPNKTTNKNYTNKISPSIEKNNRKNNSTENTYNNAVNHNDPYHSFLKNNDNNNENNNNMFLLNSVEGYNGYHYMNYKNYYYMLEKVSLNMYYYLEGLKYNIYRFQFPECMRGFLFQTASEYLYQKHSAFLIGIITINKEIFLNPINYIIGEENKYYYTTAFSGIILTTSLDNLIKLSSIKNISKNVYEYNNMRIQEKYNSISKNVNNKNHKNFLNKDEMNENAEIKIVLTCNESSSYSDNSSISTDNFSYDINLKKSYNTDNSSNQKKIKKKKSLPYNFVLGIYEINNYISAYQDIFIDKKKPLLLVCGWPSNIHLLFKYLKINLYNSINFKKKKKKNYASIKYNVIILSLHIPKFNYVNDLFDYSNNIAFIRGSALNSTNLIQAGVFYAKRIIILNANHSLYIDKDAYRLDNEVIIIKNIIYQLYHHISKNRNNYTDLLKKIFKNEFRDRKINDIFFLTEKNFDINEMDHSYMNILIKENTSSSNYYSSNSSLQKESKKSNYDIFNVNKNPYIICLIKNSESLEYIDGSINLSYENYNDNEKMNKIWENCGEYIYTLELVSANIFVDEMLHNLVSFSLPISKYAIEYSVIYSLIGIDINEYSKNIKTFHENLNLSTGSVYLVPIPSYFYKKSFYKCFSYFLHNKQCLCIGILRYLNISPLFSKSKKLFILSCPSRTMKIEQNDKAYVIAHKWK